MLDATNFAAGETVNVTLTADSDSDDDVATISYTVSQSGGGMEYDGMTISPTTVNITDEDEAAVEFRVSGGSVWHETLPELEVTDTEMAGGTTDLEIRLSHQPRADVSVDMSAPSNSGITSDDLPVTFAATDWSTSPSKTVTLTYAGDDNSYSETHELDFSVSGYGDGTISDQEISIDDTDPVGWEDFTTEYTLNESDAGTSAGAQTWNLVPQSRPSTRDGTSARVDVATTGFDGSKLAVTSLATLNASDNWEDGLELIARVLQDDDGANETVTVSGRSISLGGDYDNVEIPDVVFTIIDDDTPEVEIAGVLTTNVITMTERADDTAATATFRARLSTVPTNTVTVSFE